MSAAPSSAEALAGVMARRYSCRAFRPDAAPDDVIQRIVDAGRRAASWSNTQPWEIVVTRPDTTAALARRLMALARAKSPAAPDIAFPPSFAGAYLERRREVGFGLYEALGIAREDRAGREAQNLQNFRFFGAPHVALLTVPAGMGDYGALDLGGFLAHFMLAAEAEGLASIAQAALAAYGQTIREYIGVPDDRAFLCGVSFGYADLDHPANRFRASRAARNEIFRFA